MKASSTWMKPYQRRRYPVGSMVAGKWTQPDPVTTTVQATVQPLRGYDLMILSEGDRSQGSVKITTNDTIQALDEKTQVKADEFFYDNHWYRVMKMLPCRGHYEAIALKITGQ